MDYLLQEISKLRQSLELMQKQRDGIEKSMTEKRLRMEGLERCLVQHKQVANTAPAQPHQAPQAPEVSKETPPRPSWAAMLAKAEAQNAQAQAVEANE